MGTHPENLVVNTVDTAIMARKDFSRFGSPTKRANAKLVKDIVREVCGFAPYEKRMIELIKTGAAAATKRANKYARKRLGNCKAAKKKVSAIEDIVSAQRKRGGD